VNIVENTLVSLFSPSLRSAKTLSQGFGGFFGANITTTSATPTTALTLSAFYNGIEILTNDIALPSKAVYKKTKDHREKVSNHPVNYLISNKPNQYMTSFMYHKMLAQYAILKGNGYAYIERNAYTNTAKAYQLITTPVKVVVSDNELYYTFKFNGKTITCHSDDMIHIPGFSINGITGVGIVTLAAQSLGVSLSAQGFSSDYYNSMGMGSGYISTTHKMSPDAKSNIGNAFSAVLSNSDKWRVPVLDEGMDFHPIQITAQEAQFLATSKHGIGEVARWLNIPPHKLKLLDNTNNSITENLEIMHNQDSVLPWVTKFEQEYNAKLFTEAEKKSYFVKYNLNVLMRADSQAQSTYFTQMILNGSMTRNEVRGILDLNPIDGLDQPLTPVNAQIMEMIDANLKLKQKEIKS